MNIFLNLLDLIYKKKCYCCSSSEESLILCSKCYESFNFNIPQTDRIIDSSNVYIAGEYTKNLQKIIRGLKFHNKRDLAYYLAKYMSEYYKKLDLNKDFQVVPIPLHESRKKKRKFNHMELVAEEFCELTNLTYNKKLITRIKNTIPQYKLSKAERIKNLENAFSINMDHYNNKPILLIDDICSSGATFHSIIKELNKNKITNITCFAATSP